MAPKNRSALILYNIAKNRNFGQLIRTANALGCAELIVVGRKRFSTYGNFATDDGRKRKHFFNMDEARAYLSQEGYALLGIEIREDAKAVEQHPFSGSCAFLPGNEGHGLSTEQQSYCDDFVYIRQFGLGASLNVNVATGIVLHHFASWANYVENSVEGNKFRPGET